MDFGTLKLLLAMNLDDKLHQYFLVEPDLRVFLNASYQFNYNELMKRDIFPRVASQTISVVSGTQETALSNSNKIHKVLLITDTDGNPIPRYSEEYSRRSNVKSCYVAELMSSGGRTLKLGWYQKPTSNFDLIVKYAEKVNQFTSGSLDSEAIEDIPAEYHNVIVLYATILAIGKDEENIQTWVALYNNEFEAMIEGIGTVSQEASEVVDYSYGQN